MLLTLLLVQFNHITFEMYYLDINLYIYKHFQLYFICFSIEFYK